SAGAATIMRLRNEKASEKSGAFFYIKTLKSARHSDAAQDIACLMHLSCLCNLSVFQERYF
ncbi:hypothetical protein, partial [Pseudochrobactrum sp. AO18b]|uniref:hypothetical protein n=1 Tax=Pseudochrobactrum sp. AO18b TaxID=1201036 RepID=UPI001AEBF553